MAHSVTVTEEVIDLIEQLNIDRHSDIPQISSKRPFGNSDYYTDVLRVAGEYDELTDEHNQLTQEGRERAEELFDTVTEALKILVTTQELEVGVYQKTSDGWVKR